MVNFEPLSKMLEELSAFFSEIIESPSASSTDKKSATYGLEEVHFMTDLMRKYAVKPSNVILKGIHGSLYSINGGVEGFNDLDLDRRFREKKKPTYYIVKDLEKNIKW